MLYSETEIANFHKLRNKTVCNAHASHISRRSPALPLLTIYDKRGNGLLISVRVFGDTSVSISKARSTLLLYPGAPEERHTPFTPSLSMPVHVGHLIKTVFESHPKEHNIKWFASMLNCRRGNIYNIFNRSTIDTELLIRISLILNHDFFADISYHISQDTKEE